MRRKMLTLFIAFTMTMSMSSVAFAESTSGEVTDYGVNIGGVEITSENASDVTGKGISGSVSYNPETECLTLNNATIQGDYKIKGPGAYGDYSATYAGLYSTHFIEVKLIGTNTIERGIDVKTNEIDFTGAGSITVNPPRCETGSLEVVSCGQLAVCKDVSVTINGASYTTDRALVADEVAVEGYLHLFSPSSQNSFGLEARTSNGGVYIEKTGKLEIYASTAEHSSQWACGIQTFGGEIINLGKLIVTTKGGKTSDGICAKTVTLADGSTTEINSACYAIGAEDLKYGKNITCKAGSSSGYAYAAKPGAAFSQKYFKAGKSLGGKVKPTTLKSLTRAKKAMTVKWNKRASYFISGYQVQYSTSSKFKNGKRIKVNCNTASKKIKNLKSKKRYYVRIRTYRVANGTTKYSGWSKSKSVVVK